MVILSVLSPYLKHCRGCACFLQHIAIRLPTVVSNIPTILLSLMAKREKKNKRAAWLTSLFEVAGPVSSNLTTAPIRQYTSYRSERNRWRNCVFRYSLLFLCFSFFFKNELFLYFHRAPWPLFTSGRKNSYISRLFNFVFGPHWFLLYTGGKARHLSSSHKVKITLTSFPFSPIFSFVRLTLYK